MQCACGALGATRVLWDCLAEVDNQPSNPACSHGAVRVLVSPALPALHIPQSSLSSKPGSGSDRAALAPRIMPAALQENVRQVSQTTLNLKGAYRPPGRELGVCEVRSARHLSHAQALQHAPPQHGRVQRCAGLQPQAEPGERAAVSACRHCTSTLLTPAQRRLGRQCACTKCMRPPLIVGVVLPVQWSDVRRCVYGAFPDLQHS